MPVAVNFTMRSGYPGLLRTSVQGGLILYLGNNPIAVPGHGNGTEASRERLRELSEGDSLRRRAVREALAWMRDHPLAVLRNIPRKLYWLWLARPEGFGWRTRAGGAGGLPMLAARGLGSVAYVQWLLVLGAGLLGLWRCRDRLGFWLVVLAGHSALFALLSTVPRFHMPFEPLLMLGAAAVLARDRPEQPDSDPFSVHAPATSA